MIDVKPVPAFRDNYIWLITNPADRTAAVIDPGDPAPVSRALDEGGWRLAAILVTHHHPDHTGGVAELARRHGVPVYGPAAEAIPSRTVAVREGDRVTLEAPGITFEVLEVPGHTAGHVAYHGRGMLFIGDTLFMSGCGRLFEGTPAQMHRSLSRIAKLPPDTKVYCAHEYTLANLRFARAVEPDNRDIAERADACAGLRANGQPTVPATLAVELKTNPFLRSGAPAVVAAAERQAGRKLDSEVEVFAAIRKWKDNF